MISDLIIDILINIFLYLISVVICIGIVGNIIAFIIFFGKKFENTIIPIYFRILAITDTGTLILAINRFLILKWGIRLRNHSHFLCVSIAYLFYIIPALSGWFLVFISIDRWIHIFKPTKLLFKKKFKFQLIASTCLILFNMIYYGQILFSKLETTILFDESTNQTLTKNKCILININGNLDWMDLFNSTLIPFIFMIFFTSMTVKLLYKVRNKIRKARKIFNAKKTFTRNKINNNIVNHVSQRAHSDSNTTRSRDTKYAITSITLNFIFFVLNIPICVFTLVRDYGPTNTEVLIDYIVSVLYYINFGSLFYINIMVNSIFREEFFGLFKRQS
jgi:hypothetical protein